ncbi:hypothetical protein HMPREF9436_03000 [Faecalibacterium cf. prausnitzii KLE1255]|uniref:Uncharacterized protein n=1 Tax=Faecalibacterium cf. prausnitzii KLE1255 TaxID=748224 RepID=E2ZMS1_9FIRM|nr:hypothetical protein HMPREF9436_03000 [Faecalibacterium cf. prausnitzii KLE1255]
MTTAPKHCSTRRAQKITQFIRTSGTLRRSPYPCFYFSTFS